MNNQHILFKFKTQLLYSEIYIDELDCFVFPSKLQFYRFYCIQVELAMLSYSFCFIIQRMDKIQFAEKEQKKKGRAEDGSGSSSL